MLAALALMAAGCARQQGTDAAPNCIPHLEKRGGATQLIVDGKPFLALAGELKNSSSSSAAYMEPRWGELKGAGLNTVIGVLSWEQIEPAEGSFDFTTVDDLISAARSNGLKLVLIWMGSWKNGITSYDPAWVKSDTERFALAMTQDGLRLPILSTQSLAARDADARAYAATMRHIREVDSDHTVIMMQMENEVGLHGSTRDFSPEAVKAFEGDVPAALIEYLTANEDSLLPETSDAWTAAGKKTSGSWQDVFGTGDRADEFFMAWSYASYMDAIAAAGKAEYDIPVYVNAWIVQPEDSHPGDYPSGGPQAQCHDIWRAAAPHIDILSPDIYLPDYPAVLRMYSRSGNPVFVPESKGGLQGAANAAFTFGEMCGIGYSPFGVDNMAGKDDFLPLTHFYRSVSFISGLILDAQAEGRICGVWLRGSGPAVLSDERVLGDTKIVFSLKSSGGRNGGAPTALGGTYDPDEVGYAIAIREDDGFLVMGANVRVQFQPADGDGILGLAKVTEGSMVDGRWVEGRWLNGDEIQLRYDLVAAAGEGFSGQGLNFATGDPELIKIELFKY